MTVLLTRPEDDSREVAEELAAAGVQSLVWPLTRIVPLDGPTPVPPDAEALVFTSPNAVRAFAARSPERRLPVLAVGRRTAETAHGLGFTRAESADGDAAALAALAVRSGFRSLFHPRGAHVAADLPGILAGEGIRVAEAVVYEAEPAGPAPPAITRAWAANEIDVVSLWSARNAGLFRDLWTPHPLGDLGRVTAVAISERAAVTLENLGFRAVVTADTPDREAMMEAICKADAALRR